MWLGRLADACKASGRELSSLLSVCRIVYAFWRLKPLETAKTVELGDYLRCFGTVC